ncbi:MAG TPA: hypothetical protein VD927_19135, partial [Chryseosolibacter sp.]|nr:hypothetical protein [Chryseosolibacter sp.]
MEPDFDLLVRDRVRSADRLPLQWRKDLVWQMLSGTQLPKHRTIGRRSLMMAASVLFLLSAVVTTQEESMAPRDLSASAALTPIIKQPLVD